jgi:hypothetical protein
MSNITIINNTCIAPWGGKGVAIYGGTGHHVENNYISDTPRYIGLGVGRFGVDGSDLHSPTVTGNIIVRSGGNAYNQGQPAMQIGNGGDGQSVGIVDSATVTGNTIIDSVYDGIGFSTSTNTLLENNTVIYPWRNGIVIDPPYYPAPTGSATITDNSVSGVAAGNSAYINNSSGFVTTLSGNSWQATTTEGPYGGTVAAIPGTVLAENYDTGGQSVGYNVTSINGTDNSYRSDGVDLETTSAPGGGNDIGWTSSGQWFRYTVKVATAGTYNVTFEVAGDTAVTDAFHLSNSSGTNLTGSVDVPSTGGWQDWTTVTARVTLPAGQQTLTLDEDSGGFNIYSVAFASTAPSEGPYGGTPAGIPGTVLAENYDTGGQGVGYNVTSINGTDNGYRSDGVDLEATDAPGGGNDIGWTATGQWFRYTVYAAAAGTYNITFEVATPYGVTDGFHIANSSGTNLSGSVNIPNTGGWQTWSTTTASVTLPAGTQTLTVYQDNGGWNIYSAAFAATSLPYNVNAIYTNGSTFPSTGGADGEGDAFSPTLLGAKQAFNGTTFTYGPSNAPDAFNNVTIPLTAGSHSSLNILAYAIGGGQASQTFTVHYTNGTTSTATQSISDWGIPEGYSGETKVAETAYRNTYTGGETSTYPAYVYGYTLPVTSSLTVSSITLPANNNVRVLGVQGQQ